MCLTGLGFHEDAIRLYDQALKIMPDDHEIWFNKGFTLMEINRIPESIATYDHVLELRPLDAGAFLNRRELLKACSYKGQCTLYSYRWADGLGIGYIYTWKGTCFITLAVDDVDENDLEDYDPDEVGKYDRPERDDDGEFEVI